jgi:hypothetical protein
VLAEVKEVARKEEGKEREGTTQAIEKVLDLEERLLRAPALNPSGSTKVERRSTVNRKLIE